MENIEQIKISISKITRYQSRILIKSVNDALSAAGAGSRNILLAKLASFDSNLASWKSACKDALKVAVEANLSDEVLDKLIDEQNTLENNCFAQITPIKEEMESNDSTHSQQASVSTGVSFKLPDLKLPSFEDNLSPFDFQTFITTFDNTIKLVPNLTAEAKFLYLKNSLKGKALSLVQNLIVNDEVFLEAMQILEEQFLNKSEIINYCLEKIITYKNCYGHREVEEFINFVNQKLLELRKLDVKFDDNDGGFLMLSYLARSKLPKNFLQEVIRRTASNFPNYVQIAEHAPSIIKMFEVSSKSNSSESSKSDGSKSFSRETSDERSV